MQDPVGQNPVLRIDFITIVITLGQGVVCVWPGREKDGVGQWQQETDEPKWSAGQVHFFRASTLHAGDCVDDGQIPIESNASQEETPTQEVQVSQHAIEDAEKLPEHPSGDTFDHIERQREYQQEVGQGEVQQVDLSDAQPTVTPQEDGNHQAISGQTQKEDEAVEHRTEHRVKLQEYQSFVIAGESVFIIICVIVIAVRVIVVLWNKEQREFRYDTAAE